MPSQHSRHMPPFPWPTQTMRSVDLGMHFPLQQAEWRVACGVWGGTGRSEASKGESKQEEHTQ